MTRPRAVVPILAAIVCLWALPATSSAVEPLFRIGSGTVATVEGTGSVELSIGTPKVKCAVEKHIDKDQTFPTKQLIETIIFEQCKVEFGDISTTATLTFITQINFHSSGAAALPESVLKVPSIGCTVTSPAQEATGIEYTNETGGKLGLKEDFKGLKYGASSGCKLAGIAEKGENAVLVGSGQAKAVNEEGKAVSLEVK